MAQTAKRVLKSAMKKSGSDYFDYNLLASVILLTCFGLVMLYSTSAYRASLGVNGNDMEYFGKQAGISVAAFVMALVISRIDYHFIAKFAYVIYAGSMVLLVATKFVGRTINGARRWIYIGPISFQTAELAKVAIILFIPVLIVRYIGKFKQLRYPIGIFSAGAATAFFTYYFTENLSTAIIILGIATLLIFIAHPKTKPFVALFAGGAVLITAAVQYITRYLANTDSFRLRRIQVWLSPESYASEGGYQVMQALYAIGSGGLLGKGLGNSAQKLYALPEAQNDMIFSIICEELGVFGAGMLILLFIVLLYRLLFIAENAPDLLGSLIVTGVFVHISLQVILNIAVVINLIPTTGITLPFVSYGGTSILFLMSEIALALSVSRQIKFRS